MGNVIFVFYTLFNIPLMIVSGFRIKQNAVTQSDLGNNVAYIEKGEGIVGGGFQFHIPEKLVHLDLKGAPPRMEILQQFIPMVKQLGGTGLLIEYEDMFPYGGELQIIQAYNAYSKENVARIVELAVENDLQVVPLVQTIGHLCFLLKHGRFGHLRALSADCDTVCVCDSRVKEILKEMITEVVKLHPNITMIHLGGDEAANIKQCESCSTKASSAMTLQIEHITELARFVKNDLGVPRVLIWNDVTGGVDASELNRLETGELVEPVVWGYTADVTKPGYFPDGMFDRYSKVFRRIWFGSAFKGATEAATQRMSIQMPHLENHKSYMRLITSHWAELERRSVGFIVTGWSRICHFDGLMELLSMGVPSLGVMLQFLRDNGTVQPSLFENVATSLHCDVDLAAETCHQTPEVDCFRNCSDFGSRFRSLFGQFETIVAKYREQFQVRPMHSYPWDKKEMYALPPYQDDVEETRKALYLELLRITFESSAQEWISNIFDKYYSSGWPMWAWLLLTGVASVVLTISVGSLLFVLRNPIQRATVGFQNPIGRLITMLKRRRWSSSDEVPLCSDQNILPTVVGSIAV